MEVTGKIYTKVDVDTFQVIERMCQCIGVVDEGGHICAYIEKGKIVKYNLDIFGDVEKKILYDQPFDVKYASTLIRLFVLSKEYLSETFSEDDKSNDYETVHILKLKNH